MYATIPVSTLPCVGLTNVSEGRKTRESKPEDIFVRFLMSASPHEQALPTSLITGRSAGPTAWNAGRGWGFECETAIKGTFAPKAKTVP
jgi:hypothetical protein